MSKRVVTATETENWRTKYFDSLGRLESEQEQFRAMEAALKRLIGRLCTAALGQSPQLDEQIRKLQAVVRRDTNIDELAQLTSPLTDAIGALDHPMVAPPSAVLPAAVATGGGTRTSLDEQRLRAILSALLTELRRDTELLEQSDALDAKLATPLTTERLPEVLETLTDLVIKRIGRVEQAKQEVEVLLGAMVGKLDEIGQFVAEQNQNQTQSQASSETLNKQLAGEMKAMGESVDAAGDLQQIRQQVRSRLDSIDRHLQEFRQRETTFAAAIRNRNDQMRSRIVELEAEAKRLHSQLQDEQRLSTIDALTKIPNRLAYEKRIDEELNRWRRFGQPICLAVWDVDHFKTINDSYGHRAGDRVLRAVAECFAGKVRSTDFVARYGGEEFVMILPGTQLDDAARFSERLRASIAEIGFHFRGAPVSITVSSGVTALRADDTAEAVFDRADKAMYRAKESGRNRCVTA
ncbi:GGDEF domain-containing protein [Steroidobacter sp.]|uniref:GGDEF domain-containing protein n=1 Tax=Steroidobacter sp. TaxID=1978227 RepID=UPI0025E5D90A|nr:GGDEF domain-containing protein [Steroidobacter sp.]